MTPSDLEKPGDWGQGTNMVPLSALDLTTPLDDANEALVFEAIIEACKLGLVSGVAVGWLRDAEGAMPAAILLRSPIDRHATQPRPPT